MARNFNALQCLNEELPSCQSKFMTLYDGRYCAKIISVVLYQLSILYNNISAWLISYIFYSDISLIATPGVTL